MKYQLEIEIAENEISFAEKFFKNISFVRSVKAIANNEITNPAILQSIEDYKKRQVTPTPLNLAELKAMIDACASFYAQSLAGFRMVDEKRFKKREKDTWSFRKLM